MMKLGFALVMVMGCGAKPAEPLSPPGSTPLTPDELQLSTPPHHGPVRSFGGDAAPPADEPVAMFPRPAIDTPIDPPDVSELGRWPLTIAEHPSLEPHFDIASALADAGVTWLDLCARGAQHRHMAANQELVEYLDAWCSVGNSDYSAAIVKLGLVRHAPNRRLVEALKLDVAAIAAAHGPAHDLESFLRAGGFLEVDQADLISAAYFEIGKLDDAEEANQLAQVMDVTPTEKVRCTRMLRAVADSTTGDDAMAALRLSAFPPPNDIRKPHCRDELNGVLCSKNRDCTAYWDAFYRGAPSAVRELARVYTRWNRNRTGEDWYRAAFDLIRARPFRDRYTLLVVALDLAVRESCAGSSLRDIDDVARIGIEDLAPPRPTAGMDPAERATEAERVAQRATLMSADVQRFRGRLVATRARAQALASLATEQCQQEQAKLPPVQP